MPTPTEKRRAAIRATMPAAKVAAMTDHAPDAPPAPEIAARPPIQIHANGISLQPSHLMGPEGPIAMVNMILHAGTTAAATLPLSIDELKTHVENCQKLIAAQTGEALYVPPKPELIVAGR